MRDEFVNGARILIVDDQKVNVDLLVEILKQEGYRDLRSTTDPREALPLFFESNPDLVLLDLRMPYMDGFTLLGLLNAALPPDTYLPMLVLTADLTPSAKQRALSMGARDFLTKPFDPIEVLLRIRNLLETRILYKQLQQQKRSLEDGIRERTLELEEARVEVLERLALAAEYRDYYTGQHTQRVGELSAYIAQALALPCAEVELIRRAAPLHDVGKIAIPDSILLKPGKLDIEERELMKCHTTIGARILSGSKSAHLQLAETIALTHHEHWNGNGYPHGLRGEAIPLVGRIVAVADVFDALTHRRPYKQAWSRQEAVSEIKRQCGRFFAPDVVEAFFHVLNSQYAPVFGEC